MVKDNLLLETSYRGIVQWAGHPGFHQALCEILLQNLALPSNILDCGTGPGAFALRLKDLGFTVEAIERDSEVYQATEVLCHSLDLNDSFSSQITARFDAITAVEVIEHLENPRHFLRQCHQLLHQDGILLLTTPSIESIPARLRFLVTGNFRSFDSDRKTSEPSHITPIQSYLFGGAIAECGFTLLMHRIYPDGKFTNSRLPVKVLSWLLAPLCSGNRFGCNHIFLLKKVPQK